MVRPAKQYAEFDIEADPILLMVCSNYSIAGVIECNTSTTIIADIVCVNMVAGKFNQKPGTFHQRFRGGSLS